MFGWINTYVIIWEKYSFFDIFSSLNNLYNARVEVNETGVYIICHAEDYRILSLTYPYLDLIQNTRKCCNTIITYCRLQGEGMKIELY